MSKTEYSKVSQKILFHYKQVSGDLYRYLTEEDVLTLLNRLPVEEYQHLKSITFKTGEGADAYGFVYHKRATSIVICDQAQRLSIRTSRAKKGSLDEYGALNNMKWPTLAVKRYLLYNTFLHELRHTQIVQSGKKYTRDKMPNEKQADEYADFWRGELYRQHFEHHDPVHNLPTEEEKERLQLYWPEAMKWLQKGIQCYSRKDYAKALEAYELSIEKMKLYYGDLYPVNYDVEKLDDTLRELRSGSKTIVISKKPNEALFDQTIDRLVEWYEEKIIKKWELKDYATYCDLEIRGERFLLELQSYFGISIYPSSWEGLTKVETETEIELIDDLKQFFAKKTK